MFRQPLYRKLIQRSNDMLCLTFFLVVTHDVMIIRWYIQFMLVIKHDYEY